MGLNENQKRAVYITLAMVDEMLSELERLSLNQSISGVLHRMDTSLTEPQQQKMFVLIHQAREEMKRIAETFQFQPKIRKIQPKISGILTIMWNDLEDIKSSKLKGYGTVDPQLKETLDPHLDRLIELIMNFQTTNSFGKGT